MSSIITYYFKNQKTDFVRKAFQTTDQGQNTLDIAAASQKPAPIVPDPLLDKWNALFTYKNG